MNQVNIFQMESYTQTFNSTKKWMIENLKSITSLLTSSLDSSISSDFYRNVFH